MDALAKESQDCLREGRTPGLGLVQITEGPSRTETRGSDFSGWCPRFFHLRTYRAVRYAGDG